MLKERYQINNSVISNCVLNIIDAVLQKGAIAELDFLEKKISPLEIEGDKLQLMINYMANEIYRIATDPEKLAKEIAEDLISMTLEIKKLKTEEKEKGQ